MTIDKLSAINFLVFKRNNLLEQMNNVSTVNSGANASDAFNIDFTKGINIIIGENGTGKTTLLKMLYAACEYSNRKIHLKKAKDILDYFISDHKSTNVLKNLERSEDYSQYSVTANGITLEYSASHGGFINLEDWLKLNINSVFIPTKEMLSHAKGLLALNEKYQLPFDATLIDIIVNAELPETRKVSDLNPKILKILSDVIDGSVIFEEDAFFVLKNDGNKMPFALEAEGLRKFGLLWKIIRNGLIEKNSVLFWDEPEANINPQLIPKLVDILMELQRNGVQLFIATHDYNLAKYFELKRKDGDQVLYHCLYKTDDIVSCKSNEFFGNLGYNPIIDADERLLDEVFDKNLGD